MKKAVYLIPLILVIIFGLFVALYFRQPLGFTAVIAAVLTILFYIFYKK